MIRDIRKNSVYFEKYLEYQEKRIEQFLDVLGRLQHEAGKEAQIQQCYVFLANYCKDKFSAQYSYGCEIEELKNTFVDYYECVKRVKDKSYSDLLSVLSLAILLEIKIEDQSIKLASEEDALTRLLYDYSINNAMTTQPVSEEKLLFPETMNVFYQCLKDKGSSDKLKFYLDNEWYESQKESSWYDSDKSNNDTYCGYWCYLGAAIIKICQFDKESFKKSVYVPVDLI